MITHKEQWKNEIISRETILLTTDWSPKKNQNGNSEGTTEIIYDEKERAARKNVIWTI